MSPAAFLLIFIVKLYQITLSPILGSSCRFYPTCSNYSLGAIREHGAFRGGYLTVRRLLKCHPWHAGGHDPVPEKTE